LGREHGILRQQRRLLPPIALRCPGLLSHRARRHLRSGLSAHGGGALVWALAAAKENQGQQGHFAADAKEIAATFPLSLVSTLSRGIKSPQSFVVSTVIHSVASFSVFQFHKRISGEPIGSKMPPTESTAWDLHGPQLHR